MNPSGHMVINPYHDTAIYQYQKPKLLDSDQDNELDDSSNDED